MAAVNTKMASGLQKPRVTLGKVQAASTLRPSVPVRGNVVASAAAPETDFVFSMSDAKKGNEYTAIEVETAMAYYAGEGGSATDYESEHVVNEFSEGGFEDASFFDDIDNNEAYDDEFVCAGIPEAAPKKPSRNKDGEEEADDNEIAAAAAASKLREIEENMVLEAEMEETGLTDVTVTSSKKAVAGPAVWDWLSDVAVDDEDSQELNALARGTSSISADVASALPSEEQLVYDMRVMTAQMQDLDLETKEMAEFLVDDFDLENELSMVPEPGQAEEAFPEVPELDEQAIQDLLNADLEVPTFDRSILNISDALYIADDGLDMPDEVVNKYIADLEAAQPAELTQDEVNALFADEPAQLLPKRTEEPVDLNDPELAEPEAVELADLDQHAALEDDVDDVPDVDDFIVELNSLRAMPDPSSDPITAEEMDTVKQYLDAAEQFLQSEEERKMAISAAVANGELPAEALEDEIDVVEDSESALLNSIVDDDEDFNDGTGDDANENWQERIIELNRVTKVVKGGKLMGFRCTAIVGNGAGLVGVGCQAGREVATAVKRALVDAKKKVVRVPLVGAGTIPHRSEAKFHAARCVVLPAAEGTGVLAGGSIRSVLELAGVQNVLAKRLGCRSPLNNARCAVRALEQLRTLNEVAASRGVPMSHLLLPQ